VTLTHRPLRGRFPLSRNAGEGKKVPCPQNSLAPTGGEGWGEGAGRYTTPAARISAISSAL
jgi:hypothetical protein